MRKINHLQGILSILSVALPTALIAHLPVHSVGCCLLCLTGHRILTPFPQCSGQSSQQHMALTSLHHHSNSTFLAPGELHNSPNRNISFPFPQEWTPASAGTGLSEQHHHPTAIDKDDSLVSLHSFKSGEVFAKKE